MVYSESHIELVLQYERTFCLILMLQYGRTLRVTFTPKWNPFTIRNAIRESLYWLLANGYNAKICNFMYICWHMNFVYFM